MRILILGSKEYPFGDIEDSGGIEIYVENLVKFLKATEQIILITRGHEESYIGGNPEIYKVKYKKGFYLKTPSFIIKSFFKSLKLNFDVIISHGEISNLFSLTLSKIRNKPIIMVSHGLPSEQPQYNPIIRFGFKLIEKLTYPFATKTITHAPYQMIGLTRRFEVIEPGLDRSKLRKISKHEQKQLKETLGIKSEKVIIYTGRLIRVKGLEYLFRALTELKCKYKCLIVGDGPDRKFYENMANQLKLNIEFLGYKNDVNKYLSISDVFVLPSLSESLNYSMIEAAYMGVPIIATDLNIIPNNSAIIVPKKDSKAIKLAIEKILSNKKARDTIIKNAKNFTKKFNWNETTKNYLRIVGDI